MSTSPLPASFCLSGHRRRSRCLHGVASGVSQKLQVLDRADRAGLPLPQDSIARMLADVNGAKTNRHANCKPATAKRARLAPLAAAHARAVLIGPEEFAGDAAAGVSHVEKAKRPNTDTIFANIRIGSRGTEHLHCRRRVHRYRAQASPDPECNSPVGKASTPRRPWRYLPPIICNCDYSLA
jgi:hypothetical protein